MDAHHQLTREELELHLAEQLEFLERSMEAFDGGFDGEAKRLAVTLRLLLHETGRSRSLLGQLGMLGTNFVDSAHPIEPSNLMASHCLIGIHVSETDVKYVPLLDGESSPALLAFEEWWNGTVFVDRDKRGISRKELIRTAADQDGGAHVDPVLSSTYAGLTKSNSLGWEGTFGPGATPVPIKSPERAAIRQIAHEVVKTLRPGYTKKLEVTTGSVFANMSVCEIPPNEFDLPAPTIGLNRQPGISGGKMKFFPGVRRKFLQERPSRTYDRRR